MVYSIHNDCKKTMKILKLIKSNFICFSRCFTGIKFDVLRLYNHSWIVWIKVLRFIKHHLFLSWFWNIKTLTKLKVCCYEYRIDTSMTRFIVVSKMFLLISSMFKSCFCFFLNIRYWHDILSQLFLRYVCSLQSTLIWENVLRHKEQLLDFRNTKGTCSWKLSIKKNSNLHATSVLHGKHSLWQIKWYSECIQYKKSHTELSN